MTIRAIFKRVVEDTLGDYGFCATPKKDIVARRIEPWIEQSVELTRSRTHGDQSHVIGLMLFTSIEAFRDLPGDFGPELDWQLTMNALIDNPFIDSEFRVPKNGMDQAEQWMLSMARELDGAGLDFFARSSSLEKLVGFTDSDFYRKRAASHSELYAKLQKAMLLKLLDRPRDSEEELARAHAACHSRWRSDLDEFCQILRDYQV